MCLCMQILTHSCALSTWRQLLVHWGPSVFQGPQCCCFLCWRRYSLQISRWWSVRWKISLLVGKILWIAKAEYGTWTTPVSGVLWQLNQPKASVQLQGEKKNPLHFFPTHITIQSAVWLHYSNASRLLKFRVWISMPTTVFHLHPNTVSS